MNRPLLCAAAALLAAATARPATRAGGEFRVNGATTGEQASPAVAMDPSGRFVVVWETSAGPSGFDVLAQRYGTAGEALGAPFLVNTTTTGLQYEPSVAADARGAFTVVWSGEAAGGLQAIFGQRFAADGSRRGVEFRASEGATARAVKPVVAASALGDFVVVWPAADADGTLSVFGRRYDRAGAARGGAFRVNTTTALDQRSPSVAVAPDGGFVVAWQSDGQDGDEYGIIARHYSPAGDPGPEFQVNVEAEGEQIYGAVAALPGGTFIVTWEGYDADGFGIVARTLDADGVPQGDEFVVNTFTTGFQGVSAVTADGVGRASAAWSSAGDGSDLGVRARRLTGFAEPDFQVNTYTTFTQTLVTGDPRGIASDAAGNLVVTWQSFTQDGDGAGVFAQRFGGVVPVALRVDAAAGGSSDGDGVLEPGETVEVRPTWRNATGAPLALTSVARDLSGPAGAAYTLVDGSAAYGTLPDGASAACTDCFAVHLSAPAARPAPHWDATFTEAVQPEPLLGQQRRWTLHVGDSFTDVPRASPFYRFAEALLHRGVTTGCGAGVFCPRAATTREQMAAFALLAAEGAGYAPPSCAAPLFADVPSSTPFCRYVEELARRGITGGCGGGRFCPQDPVSREQMAVFLLRALDPALIPPACTTPAFADVPAASPFCRWIAELSRRGITSGCGGGNYCPSAPVTREQMAAFLTTTFTLTLDGSE